MAKQIRAARHYQRDDDPVLRLSRSAQRGVARELQHAFNNLSSMVPVEAVANAIRQGRNPSGLVNWHHYREVLRGAFDRLGKLRSAGGGLGARKINGVFAARGRKVRFRPRIAKGVASLSLVKAKASKLEAGYQDSSKHMPDHCGTCWMFQSIWQCCAVEGAINPNGWCNYYETVFTKAEADDLRTAGGVLVGKATGDQFSFDSFSPEVQDDIRQAQDNLIQQLEQDARDTIETIIADGTINGTDVEDIASDIADMIGLTDTQAQAVLNYQRMLQDLDPQALARQLRNSDYDAAVQDAIDSGEDLSDAAVENMVSDYIENYIDYRAATIASTESTRAANLGLHDAYSQAIDRGALTDEAVTRVWQLGDNPCPICESIVDLNPDGVGVNDTFDSIDGPQDDPPVHPNCECSVDYVTDLTQVPDDGEDTGDPGPGSFGVGGVDTPYMDDGGE